MLNLIEIQLDNQTKIYFETSKESIQNNNDNFLMPIASNGKIIRKGKEFLDTVINQVKTFSNSIVESIKATDFAPDEVEIEFATKFSADGEFIITSVGTETSFNIKLKWKNS